jgi:hypothetical protein
VRLRGGAITFCFICLQFYMLVYLQTPVIVRFSTGAAVWYFRCTCFRLMLANRSASKCETPVIVRFSTGAAAWRCGYFLFHMLAVLHACVLAERYRALLHRCGCAAIVVSPA